MQPITITYPHTAISAEALGLEPRQVWSVAQTVRSQLVVDALVRKLEVEHAFERASAFRVNGVSFSVHWDLEHDLYGEGEVPVMGMTEFDPAEPHSIYVSVNGKILGGHMELLRSTTAHEFGHVVFDAPGWVRHGVGLRAVNFADVPAGRPAKARKRPFDARELRANEFMGALLVPPALLRVDFQRLAKRYRFAASERPSAIFRGSPAYEAARLDEDALAEVHVALAERYGVSESFIRVRLSRYDLLRTGMSYAV
jgi:hypothetical protein